MHHFRAACVLGFLATALPTGLAQAQTCTRDAARRIVDDAGARLRTLTSETQPKLQARLRQLKDKRGWTGAEGDEKAAAIMADARTAELDSKASQLLARIDELSEGGTSDQIDCARIAELEATSLELQATVRAKSQHMTARLDQAIAGDAAASPAAAAAPPAPSSPQIANAAPPPAAAPVLSQKPSETVVPAPSPAPPAPELRAARPDSSPAARDPAVAASRKPATGWSTETVERRTIPLPPIEPQAASPPPLPLPPPATGDGFSRDEIAEASRGFFGTISAGLGNVIEHAFSTLGRPTAYVLGNEGGGAFIAGVRYGKGQLFMRDGTRRDVHWHGPSIGYDIGASGSKTMFLVYNLQRDLDIFSGFTGVDGSAYLVGGVGMTVLTDGKVVMAPIRSGVGLRLGASIGYVRFTARPTWNPF
ncbi:MAG: EipA family protein [Hyphomicrobiaceae bacterium]|nr:EipA family protein [Hyphomicrobiaceae bacterium]